MKCCAPVEYRALTWRADLSTDHRCQRAGKYRVAGKLFCPQHAYVWHEHYALVERIRAIPNRAL